MDSVDIVDQELYIGQFGDERLCRSGMLLYSRMIERSTVCLRRLSDDRATQRRFHRFLEHHNVTPQEIIRHGSERTAKAAAGRHVLAIQDTSELDYSSHRLRTSGLGSISNHSGCGLLIHPTLAVDAQSNACLGIVDQAAWVRDGPVSSSRSRRPIEEKESMRWVQGAQTAKERLHDAALVTVVADRESDIYEEWDRIPDGHTHLLTRARHDRQLEGSGTLSQWLAAQPVMANMALDVPKRAAGKAFQSTDGGRSRKHTAHRAHMELRFGQVSIARPQGCKADHASITLRVIEVRESLDTVPPDELPIHWVLLTSHEIQAAELALEVVGWYQQRWQIEQLFRTLKQQGLETESSQLEQATELLKLVSIATLTATRTLQLVNARDGTTNQLASDVFDDDSLAVLASLQPKLQGKTTKLQNPHAADTLAWASWTIARLGGWTGSSREAKPGPITMLHGQQRLDSMVQGWVLAKMWA